MTKFVLKYWKDDQKTPPGHRDVNTCSYCKFYEDKQCKQFPDFSTNERQVCDAYEYKKLSNYSRKEVGETFGKLHKGVCSGCDKYRQLYDNGEFECYECVKNFEEEYPDFDVDY